MKEPTCPKEMPSENPSVDECISPVSDEQREKAAKERKKQYRREYYLKNKERINAKRKEYLAANRERLCAWHREYRAANKERLCAQNREYWSANKERLSAQNKEYRAANRERIRASMMEYCAANRERLIAYKREHYAANREHLLAQKKEYREANRERIRAHMREYYATNRERLIAYKREHYAANKDRLAVKRKEYYENNKYMCCYNQLNRGFFKSIEQIRRLYPEKINHYMFSYPFEEYAERYIKGELYRKGIYSSHAYYADCYDAGMLAYLYSIHRCAAMDCNYVEPYIIKMVKICIICALVVYGEAKNLCRTNGFRQIQLDAADFDRGY